MRFLVRDDSETGGRRFHLVTANTPEEAVEKAVAVADVDEDDEDAATLEMMLDEGIVTVLSLPDADGELDASFFEED